MTSPTGHATLPTDHPIEARPPSPLPISVSASGIGAGDSSISPAEGSTISRLETAHINEAHRSNTIPIEVPGGTWGNLIREVPVEKAYNEGKVTLDRVQQIKKMTHDQMAVKGWVEVTVKVLNKWYERPSTKMLLKTAIQEGYMTVEKAVQEGHLTESQAQQADWLPPKK